MNEWMDKIKLNKKVKYSAIHATLTINSWLIFRLEPGKSFFDRLPNPIDDVAVEYNIPCSCHRENENGERQCIKELPVHYPNVLDSEGRVILDLNSGSGERKRRDIHYSDDLTDEDFEIFKHYVGSAVHHRFKRELLSKSTFTKENATLFCTERVTNTEAGKLCAKLGANVQAMVNACVIDLEVTRNIWLRTALSVMP